MWRTIKLGEVCELAYGKALDKSERLDNDGVPAFGANGIKTYAKKSLFDEPSIIVGRKGSAGEITKVDEPFWALDVTYYVKIDRNIIDLNFLFYTLTTLNLPSMARGVKPGINRNDVYDKRILLPPLAEQQRIVAKLDATFAEIDAAIELSKKQAISASDYGYRIIKTTLEELSEQHGLSSLSNTAVIQPKKKLALAKLNEDDDVSFMGMDGLGIEEKYSQPETIKKLSEVYKSYQYFEDNDVIFAKITPCFENGKLSIVKGLTNGVGFGSSEFVVLRTHANFQPEFLYYCLLDEVFRNNGADNMSGAVGHKRVTKEYFSNYTVPTPPLDVQQLISKKIDEVWKNTKSIVSAKHKKIEELTNLKSAILKQELQSEAA